MARLMLVHGQLWTPNMPRKPANVRMMNKAIDYLGRYASSRHKLGQILQRFANRKLPDYDAEDIDAAIQQTIDQCSQLGYVDDRQFAVTGRLARDWPITVGNPPAPSSARAQ